MHDTRICIVDDGIYEIYSAEENYSGTQEPGFNGDNTEIDK